jgi:hypothetical protein
MEGHGRGHPGRWSSVRAVARHGEKSVVQCI